MRLAELHALGRERVTRLFQQRAIGFNRPGQRLRIDDVGARRDKAVLAQTRENQRHIAAPLLAFVAAVDPCVADTVNGVLAEDRVVKLPNDYCRWYISVVGNASDARYREVLGWFDTYPGLAKAKSQVHFCPVTSDTAIYKERYAANVKALPTVRLQKADGTVVYEASGRNIPMTAAGLNGAMAGAVSTAEGVRPILPWRRDMERRCPGPGPCPTPQPEPQPQPDPDPQPIDDGTTPDFGEQPAEAPVPWLAVLVPIGFVAGLGIGYGKKLVARLHPAGK
jgi:hypothetical protein